MKMLIYTSPKGKKVIFDNFVENDHENHIWSELCPSCLNHFRDIISEYASGRGEAQGCCSIVGCRKKASYYVDFNITDHCVSVEKITTTGAKSLMEFTR